MQKILSVLKNLNGNKEIVAKIKDRMSHLKDKIKKKAKEKKSKSVDETLKIIEDILDYNKGAKIFFRLHQKLIKENQNQHLKKVLQIGYN